MTKIKEILKKDIVKDVLTNLIYMILVIIYFITFNLQGPFLESKMLINYINISSMTFLIVAIVMFEMAYKKSKGKIYIYGIEFFVLSTATLFIRHIPKTINCTQKKYTEIITYTFIIYYLLKSAIQYTIKKHNELKSLSDIKEIVKEEPTKKITKRKNIKVEEGK